MYNNYTENVLPIAWLGAHGVSLTDLDDPVGNHQHISIETTGGTYDERVDQKILHTRFQVKHSFNYSDMWAGFNDINYVRYGTGVDLRMFNGSLMTARINYDEDADSTFFEFDNEFRIKANADEESNVVIYQGSFNNRTQDSDLKIYGDGTGTEFIQLKHFGDSDSAVINSGSGDLKLQTGASTKLTIDSATGNVGIGTTNPNQELDVEGSGNTQIQVTDTSSSVDVELRADGRGYVGTSSNHEFRIMTGGSSRVYVDTSGNVGIGVAAPQTDLHVNSGIRDNGMTGTGNAYVCVSSVGQLYRSATACS